MVRVVLDASALLALVNEEEGAEEVAACLEEACISAVNLSEAAAKLADVGVPKQAAHRVLRMLNVPVISFDEVHAYRAAELRKSTRKFGLSLGDRACLATAEQLNAAAVTADRAWARLPASIDIRCIR